MGRKTRKAAADARAARRVALLRIHAALNDAPEPNRATRRAAAAGGRRG